jgi:hypothetical protein
VLDEPFQLLGDRPTGGYANDVEDALKLGTYTAVHGCSKRRGPIILRIVD